MEGTVKRIISDKGFGFIGDLQGVEYFFHRTSVAGKSFDALQEGDKVTFDAQPSPKGLRAERVMAR